MGSIDRVELREFPSTRRTSAWRRSAAIQAIAAKHQVHPNQVSVWKRQAQTGLEELFAATAKRGPTEQEALIHDLHAKIGELTVERDCSARAQSLSAPPLMACATGARFGPPTPRPARSNDD